MIHARACLVLVASLAACSGGASGAGTTSGPGVPSAPAASPAGLRAGSIVKIGEKWWAIIPDGQPTMRYCFEGPLVTPALQVEGKKIHFSGTVGTISPNARLACSPFELSAVTAD